MKVKKVNGVKKKVGFSGLELGRGGERESGVDLIFVWNRGYRYLER